MNYIAVFSIVVLAGYVHCLPEEAEVGMSRSHRDILDLCSVVSTYTGRMCLNYVNYGCYCGLGGQGQPLDDVDSCCQQHDLCYENNHNCSVYSVQLKKECTENECSCKDSPDSKCSYKICQCDLKFGKCLKSAKFNPLLANHDKTKCGMPTSTAHVTTN